MPRSREEKQRILKVMRDPYYLIDDWQCPIDKKNYRSGCTHSWKDVQEYNDAWLLKQLGID